MSAGETLTHALNRKAGTTGLRDAGAANVWNGVTKPADWLDLVGALNSKAGNTTAASKKDLAGVLNQLAGTTGLDTDGAASHL